MTLILARARLALDRLGGGQQAFGHVVLEGLVLEALVGIDPGHHEHREALADHVADEGLLRPEIEDVELVDPRRHDQQRRLVHGRRLMGAYWMSWMISFWKTTLPGAVATLRPTSKASMSVWLMLSRSPDLLHVVHEVGHAVHEVAAARGKGLAQHHGIGDREIRGRERARHLLQVELSALARALVEPLGLVQHILEPARGDEIGLLPEIEVGVAAPLRIVEAVVAGLGLGDRQRLGAHHALRRGTGELQVVAGQRGMRLDQLARVRHPILGDLGEQLGGLGHLAGHAERPGIAVAALQ